MFILALLSVVSGYSADSEISFTAWSAQSKADRAVPAYIADPQARLRYRYQVATNDEGPLTVEQFTALVGDDLDTLIAARDARTMRARRSARTWLAVTYSSLAAGGLMLLGTQTTDDPQVIYALSGGTLGACLVSTITIVPHLVSLGKAHDPSLYTLDEAQEAVGTAP